MGRTVEPSAIVPREVRDFTELQEVGVVLFKRLERASVESCKEQAFPLR